MVWKTRRVNFRSLYDQGFVRVAACTIRTTIADPTAPKLATEINAATLPNNALFALTDETQQTGRLAIYGTGVDSTILTKAMKVLGII